MILKTYYISQSIIEEFSKAYFPAKNQKGTAEAKKGHDASTVIRTFIVSNNYDQNNKV